MALARFPAFWRDETAQCVGRRDKPSRSQPEEQSSYLAIFKAVHDTDAFRLVEANLELSRKWGMPTEVQKLIPDEFVRETPDVDFCRSRAV